MRVEKPPDTLKFARKLSPAHQTIAVHRNNPQKHTQQVEKPPDTFKIARKLSPGLPRIAVHRYSTQKRTQRVENPLGPLRFNKINSQLHINI